MDEKELKIISEISKNASISQRDLSNRTNLSLGLVNLILKRLVKRGYLKSQALSPKKIRFFLTPKGFSEKAKKSYNYIFKTVNLVQKIKEEIEKIILSEYESGARNFVLVGQNSLADLVNMTAKGINLGDFSFKWVKSETGDFNEAVVLSSDKSNKNIKGNKVINIDDRLSDIYWGVE